MPQTRKLSSLIRLAMLPCGSIHTVLDDAFSRFCGPSQKESTLSVGRVSTYNLVRVAYAIAFRLERFPYAQISPLALAASGVCLSV